MKRTIAILLVAIMAVGSVFAAFSGEASLGFGGNFDNGNYGFIDSGAKVKIDADLATATAEQIAEGDVYASIKATFGLKLTTGEKTRGEEEDPTDVSFDGSSNYKVGIIADITEAKVAGSNLEVSILGLANAPNYAKGFQTYTVEKGIDKWGLERADFNENYNTSLPFEKATGVQATVFGYKAGFGLLGDYSSADTWKFSENINLAAFFETPEYNFNGLIAQIGTVYSYESFEKLKDGVPVNETAGWAQTNAWNLSAKVGYVSDAFSLTAASDLSLKFPKNDDVKFDADVAFNFAYDFLTVDAYYGTNPVTGKSPKADAKDSYWKKYSENMLSAQVKVDMNSFNVPVALTVGMNDIIATQEIKVSAEITAVDSLKLTASAGYTIDSEGRVATDIKSSDDNATILKDDGRKYVGKWSAGLDAEYTMDIMKITAGVSAEQKIKDGAEVKLGLNAAVETDSLIPGATLKLAWADADDIFDSENDGTEALGKVTASIKMTF